MLKFINVRYTNCFEFGNHFRFEELSKQQSAFKSNNNWSAFVRLLSEKEDISDYIESCDFHLHESFGNEGPVNVKAEEATTKETKLPG